MKTQMIELLRQIADSLEAGEEFGLCNYWIEESPAVYVKDGAVMVVDKVVSIRAELLKLQK